MKFASLLKQHSNSKAPQHIKPITINCDKNKILLNLASNKHNIQSSEQDSQNQSYDQYQSNRPFITYGAINSNMRRPNIQMNNSTIGVCLHQVFNQYEIDPSTQWIVQITNAGFINLRSRKGKLKVGLPQNKFYPSNKKSNKKKEQLEYQCSKPNLNNRSNYSPMKKLRKDELKVKQYQKRHPIFDDIQFPNQNDKSSGLNLNKFSFGDQSSKKQSQQIQFQDKQNIHKNSINQENCQNLLQKFKKCQQTLIKRIQNNENLQESIQFILQKNVQFSFQENGKGSKQTEQKSNQIHNNAQFILNTVVEVSVKKEQIKQLDQYALKQQAKAQNKYQIKVVESQFHISSQSNYDQKQQQLRFAEKKQPLQYFIREEEKFIIKTENCPNTNNQNKIQNNNKTVQHKNERQKVFINKAIPSLSPVKQQIKVMNKQVRVQQQIKQKKEQRSQSITKIYCRANIKTLTPQKIKYKTIGGDADKNQLLSQNYRKQITNGSNTNTQANLFKNHTQKIISTNSNQLNVQNRNGVKHEDKKQINPVYKKQNQEDENNDKNKLINNKLQVLNHFTPTKAKNSQESNKSGNKFVQFLQNKKAPQTQNDRVMRIVLHTPKIQTQNKVQMEKNQVKLINFKDMQEINTNNNIKTQIPANFDFDRPETPTPITNYQQYNGGVSPKSKPKIGQLMTNLALQQAKPINLPLAQTKIHNQNKFNTNQPPATNNNTNGQFVASTHNVNHYAANRTLSPNKTAYINNPINGNINSNAPINNQTTNNNSNYSHYVPYYFPATQSNQPHSVVIPTLTQTNINHNTKTNQANSRAGCPLNQFTSTYSPKPYVPYYNHNNLNQNEKSSIGFQGISANKPKIFNQLANLQRESQTSNKNVSINANNPSNLNSNNLNYIPTYKTSTNYLYTSPLAQKSNNTIANMNNNMGLNQNNIRNETISVSPLGQYTKTNVQPSKIQNNYNLSQGIAVNQNKQNYPQQLLSNVNTGIISNPQAVRPLTLKNDNNNYLRVDYAYKGAQTTNNISNNFQCNNLILKPNSPANNYIPLTSARNPNNNNLNLIQGARHAQSKVYQLKQGSSNSDINFSVQSYN